MIKENFSPIFVDGVIQLHQQLHEAFMSAAKIANKILGVSLPKESSIGFSIFIDPAENLPLNNTIKGYFMTKKKIMRFLPIEFDCAVLFPVSNHGFGEFKKGKGITYTELVQILKQNIPFKIAFRPIAAIEEHNFYSSHFMHRSPFTSKGFIPIDDDFGNIVCDFPDIQCLKIVDVPDDILNKSYSLVGKQYYSPYTTDNETYCVLFAQLDNEFDSDAIQVLRWIPANKGEELDQQLGLNLNGGDVFFEMGHISRQENTALHSFMVDNDSRLLFGKKTGDKISILGGVKIFQTNNLKYPRCLYNIKLK